MTGNMGRGKGTGPLQRWRQDAEGTSTSDAAQGKEETGAADFGSLLKQLRRDAWLTQEELAERSGLSVRTIRGLERGEGHSPRPDTVNLLAQALGLSDEENELFEAAAKHEDVAATSLAGDPEPILPGTSTPLLGRERALDEVAGFLLRSKVRLLTLTGTGGVGKTRLALEAAREAADTYPDGAVFVALAPLSDPALVTLTIARSLGLREAEGQTPREALHFYLPRKRLLLVLDNFEHLLGAAPEVAELIETCPNLAILVTSRAPLHIRGEQEYPVPPLALPASARSPAVEEVAGSPSGRLFLERARAASPMFRLEEGNASAVASICWRLAGLPLALELAAAKVRFLDPATLLSRLDRALSAGRSRDLPERQRTMRATLTWSHDLLSEPEKVLFRCLSVFAGGFTLEAAEVVGATARAVSAEDVLGLLERLVEQSLVEAEVSAPEQPRYRMLEPVRQYALERLEESGEAGEVRRSYCALFLALAERAHPELMGPRQLDWLDRLERENGNMRAAMSWALLEDESGIAARLAWALWLFWWVRGYHSEGRRWVEALLERDLSAAQRPAVTAVASFMAYTQGDHEMVERYSAETLKLSQQAGNTLCAAYARFMLAVSATHRGDFEDTVPSFQEALTLFRQSGEEGMVPIARIWPGTILLLQGDHDQAVPVLEEALAMARQRGNMQATSVALYNLAQVALLQKDYGRAIRVLEEGVTLSEQMRDRANLSYFLEGLAVLAGAQGQGERSTRLFGAAEGLMEAVGAPVYNYVKVDPSLYQRTKASALSQLGEEAFEAAWAEGQAMTFEQAVECALSRE
jgi:predicted ATPase/DNA-binding XRE family transcriptional regulator/predicted negative regulator of RcsB-dependent stress response